MFTKSCAAICHCEVPRARLRRPARKETHELLSFEAGNVGRKETGNDREKAMIHSEHPLARRAVIKGAGLGLVAGGLADVVPTQSAVAATAEDGEIWSSEYWAKKHHIPLWMYRKRLGAPKAGEASRPVLFFVHGSSISSRAFDLNVPGHGEYSVMNEFARYGFDCWTMDHENYGKSGRTSGNSDIASGVEDLKAAAEIVTRETGRQKFHFLGESSGALRAGAFAMMAPERADRLGFAAFTYKGEGSPTLTKRAEQLAYYRSHKMRKRDRDMIRSIATRDKPGTATPPPSRRWRMRSCNLAIRFRPALIWT